MLYNIKNNKDPIVIGGFVPLTTIDYPEHLSAVIFCQGCPFRCHYCHNPSLIPRINPINQYHPWQTIKNFLLTRIGLLEAVVFSGGEPTLQNGLLCAMQVIKDYGFKIGLHTAGSYPNKLKKLLKFIDWIGMDIKAPFENYVSITRIPNSGKKALQSIELILESNVKYEFRTTLHPKLINEKQIEMLRNKLQTMGVLEYKIQPFRNIGCIDHRLNTN